MDHCRVSSSVLVVVAPAFSRSLGCQDHLVGENDAVERVRASPAAPSALAALTYGGEPVTSAVPLLQDSFYVPRGLQTLCAMDPVQLYHDVEQHAHWTDPANPEMRYRGHELRRQKAFFNDCCDADALDTPPHVLRKYSYPGFQYASMQHYRPVQCVPLMHDVVQGLQRHLVYCGAPVVFNHVIATLYRDGSDEIGLHSDKTQDIRPNTSIVSVSLGEEREFVVGPERIVLQSGDIFVLGPRTNAAHKHAIVTVADEKKLQRVPGVQVGPRISLVLRDIATSITREDASERASRSQKKKRRVAEEDADAE
jgi:alkylated DNA repair dioxygenase AlkB